MNNFQQFKTLFFANVKRKTFEKHELIVPQNTTCKNVYYIEEGLARVYAVNDKGEDLTYWFSREDNPTGLMTSIQTQKPSLYGLQAMEKTIVLVLPVVELMKLKDSSLVHAKAFQDMLLAMTSYTSHRMISLQTQSAKERYEALIQSEPDLFQRVNLGHIASFLGITIQSLSRIRADK